MGMLIVDCWRRAMSNAAAAVSRESPMVGSIGNV